MERLWAEISFLNSWDSVHTKNFARMGNVQEPVPADVSFIEACQLWSY